MEPRVISAGELIRLLQREKTYAHVGVSFNDPEFDEVIEALRGGSQEPDLQAKKEAVYARHVDPLVEFLQGYFQKRGHSQVIGGPEYNVVVGMEKSEPVRFVETAEARFPNYSFMITINPAENVGNVRIRVR